MNCRQLLPLFLVVACGGVEAPTVLEVPELLPVTTQAQCPAAVQPERLSRAVAPQTPEPLLPLVPLEPGEVRRALRDQTTDIALALNEQTVFCSAQGYSASFLKVSVPDLDWLAHFDHRVDSAGLPCAAAGECSDTVTPQSLLGANASLSVVPVRVVLTERLILDAGARTCLRQLVETVTIQLKDRVLRHSAEDDLTAFPYEKCAALAAR